MPSSGIATGGAKTFNKFLKLPLEIQRNVWLFASFERRFVSVAIKRLHTLRRLVIMENEDYELFRFRSDTPVPALFSVCKESRSEATKHYKKVIVAKHNFSYFSIELIPRFYVNPDCDTICPVGEYFLLAQHKILEAMRCSKIQSIALDESQWDDQVAAWKNPLRLSLWVRGLTHPPYPLRSVMLYVGPNNGTPYTTGSRRSSKDLLPRYWDSLVPRQQCALASIVSRFSRNIAMLRQQIPWAIQRRLAKSRGLPSPALVGSAMMQKSLDQHENLEDWVAPYIQLMVDKIPSRMNSLLWCNEPFASYRCDDATCRICM